MEKFNRAACAGCMMKKLSRDGTNSPVVAQTKLFAAEDGSRGKGCEPLSRSLGSLWSGRAVPLRRIGEAISAELASGVILHELVASGAVGVAAFATVSGSTAAARTGVELAIRKIRTQKLC